MLYKPTLEDMIAALSSPYFAPGLGMGDMHEMELSSDEMIREIYDSVKRMEEKANAISTGSQGTIRLGGGGGTSDLGALLID